MVPANIAKRVKKMKKLLILITFMCVTSPAFCEDKDYEQFLASSMDEEIIDPFESYNRAMYEVNWALDRVFFRPVSEVYGFVPAPARKSVRNFLTNLRGPLTFVNNVLQLEPVEAGQTFVRTFINSTIGIGGLFDVATELGIEYHNEDFGNTLAFAGLPSGPYIILPILGPTTPRDILGRGADMYGNPVNWVVWNQDLDGALYGRDGVDLLDRRTESRGFTDEIEKAIDPYARVRSLYWQSRVTHRDAEEDDAFDSPTPFDDE